MANIPVAAGEFISVIGGDVTLNVLPPHELELAPGEISPDGTVVYESLVGGADFAVQALDSGAVRMQTIIHSEDDPLEYTYALADGFQPVEAADGTLVAYRFDEDGQFQAFVIEEPWARDAMGKPVETRYELSDGAITQIVVPGLDTTFPVVADPTWQWYAAAYGAGFSKQETRDLANVGAGAGFCGLLPGSLCACVWYRWCAVAGASTATSVL